ncbi:hypothetical protein SAY86_003902 [Trapa natans]|uniref:Ribosomal protein L34Ae n=1 Tax=Trapa natans TaxID=22666 RepID=A0AAN7MXI2_TRANT|nr:hypothetical protein SAY86_003902 [Trapa natans]
MDLFKLKKLRKGNTRNVEKAIPQPEEPLGENGADGLNKSPSADPVNEAEDEDDDFISNEMKRRLKELRNNSFMALIPEESCAEEEEEGEETEGTTSSDWRDAEDECRQWWGGFDAFYERYCERMLFFDQMSAQQLNEAAGCLTPLTPSPRSASKKLSSPFLCLSLKKISEPDDETEGLYHVGNEPYQDLETAYVAQLCLTWEALHCQFTQLSQTISCQPKNPACYNHSAQQLQQFQVLLQRFVENEPFEPSYRPESYVRSRNNLPKLLQVPNIRASEQKEVEEGSEFRLQATDLMRILEVSILTFNLFLKMDKRMAGIGNGLHLFGNQNRVNPTPLQQVLSSVEKKATQLKEIRKKSKGWKKKLWPQTDEDVHLLFGLIDVKILSRVLKMERITREQLFWCQEKMKKLDVISSDHGKLLRRDPSPVLFPC